MMPAMIHSFLRTFFKSFIVLYHSAYGCIGFEMSGTDTAQGLPQRKGSLREAIMRLFGLDRDIAHLGFGNSVQLAITEGSGHGVVHASHRSLDGTAQRNVALSIDRTAAEVTALSHGREASGQRCTVIILPSILPIGVDTSTSMV